MDFKKKKWLGLLAGILGFVLLLVVVSIAYQKLSKEYKGQENKAESGSQGTKEASGSTEKKTIPAPDVTIYDEEGNPVKLSSFFGKPIVLNFWGTWCGWCKKELPGFAAASEAYGDQVQFLYINYEQGISGSQAVNKANAYLEKEQIDITTYYDNDEDAVSTYGVYSFPMTFLIDAQGNVAAGHAGYLSEEEIKSAVQQVLLK